MGDLLGSLRVAPLLLFERVRIWIVYQLPSPRPCFQAGYWVDDDNDIQPHYVGTKALKFRAYYTSSLMMK